MKVLEKGSGQKGWSVKADCTGDGNGNGGCGAKLFVEQADMFLLPMMRQGSALKQDSATFECVECGVLTDISTVPGHVRAVLPSYADWKAKRSQ